jgi:CheY-like chemotaxis protein
VTIRKVVELTFADEGIDVTTVADGEAAMAKFVDDPPDIVLVDVGLPEMTGYDICEIIKGDETTSHIPVLLLVGSFEPFDQDAAERSRADGFLTKPFHSIRDLVNRVHELLGTQQTTEPENIVDFETTLSDDDEDENDDINDLYTRSFAETVSIENFETVPAFALDDEFLEELKTDEEQPADGEPGGDEGSIANDHADGPDEPKSEEAATEDKPIVGEEMEPASEIGSDEERVHSTPALENDWLDDEMIETVTSASPEEIEVAETDAVQAVSQYDEAPAAAVDIEPIKEFDWSPAAMVTAADENEIGIAAGLIPSHGPEEPFVHAPADHDDHVTEEIPDLQTERIPELSHEGNGFVPEVSSLETTQELPVAGISPAEDLAPTMTDLSPEMLDVIVRRVVERLSDRAVREVAQEAVPRIAEKLMREALEEDRTR